MMHIAYIEVMWFVFTCLCHCPYSVKVELCSLGRVMLHLLTVDTSQEQVLHPCRWQRSHGKRRLCLRGTCSVHGLQLGG